MRENFYLILFIIVLILAVFFYRKFKGDLFSLIWIGLILVIFISGLVKFINVNTVPEDVQSIVEKVSSEMGEDEKIRVNSEDEIELFIGGKWVNTSEIIIISNLTEKITIEYEGKRIEIMDSGLVSAIKVLKKLHIID